MSKLKEMLAAVFPAGRNGRIGVGVLAGLAVALGIAGAVYVVGRGDDEPQAGPDVTATVEEEPAVFSVSPAGDDVPRLSPIRVTFEATPTERDGAALLQLEPAVEGDYAWLGERTLLFQPAFPGLLRGREYTLHIPARPEAGLAEDYDARFTTEGALRINTVIPADGDTGVPEAAQILVQFSRSVAPLTLLSEQSGNGVLQIEPPLPGEGEWLNTSLYRYIPDALAPDTEYTITVPAGLSSEADGVLEAEYTWSFRSFGPDLDLVTPAPNSQFAAPRQGVTLVFNQPMDRASVESGFELLDVDGNATPGSFTWSDGDRRAIFTPAVDLGRLQGYTISVPAGVESATGGTLEDAWSSRFRTVAAAGISQTRPANGETGANRFGVNIDFNSPMDIDSLDGLIHVSGVDDEELFYNWYNGETGLSLGVRLEPATAYTVTVDAGGVDRYGQSLGGYTFSFTTGNLQPSLSLAIPQQVATYSAAAEPILYYHATNTSSAAFRLYPLTDAEARQFIRDGYFKFGPDGFVPSLPAIRTWSEQWDSEANTVELRSTSLSGGGPLPMGNYYVTAGSGFYSDFVFSVVDTEIVTKISHDEVLAWAIDHESGEPVGGLDLTIRGVYQGVAQDDTAATNADGLVSFPIPHAGISPYSRGASYVVETAGSEHYGVASSQWQNGAYPFDFGLPLEFFPSKYVGHIYTDRPIYRPGETIELKGVVRIDDDANYSLPEGEPPIRMAIVDSTGAELYVEPIEVNEYGSVGVSFELPADAVIGDYFITLWWQNGSDRIQIAGSGFLVAEFRVPEFEVAVSAPQPAYANGDSIPAEAVATFFFGGAVAGAQVDWTVLGTPISPRIEGYERYSFSDFDYFQPADVQDAVRASGRVTTGPDGQVELPVTATIIGDEGPIEYTIAATVVDQNNQAVASSTTVDIYPAEVIAGIRPREYVAREGTTTPVDLVTVDVEGETRGSVPATLEVYEREWVTTKERSPEGAVRYRSEPVDTLIDTLEATTGANGEAAIDVPATTAGTMRLVAVVTDAQGRTARSAAFLWVYGGEFASWRVSNNDVLDLVADAESYSVGDTAEVLVPAPFEGAIGLVTVERGKIITREVRRFESNNEVLSIPINEGSVPNVYVSVVLYRPPDATDPVPRYKVGYVELPVSTETRQLDVTIEPDRAQASPGEVVEYTIRVTDSEGRPVQAELSVAVVDKAVLSLAEERGPDGLSAFWFERGLGVQTSSSLAVSVDRANDVISEPPTGGKGGGGLDDDRLRQDFRNTAYWEAQVETDADGMARVAVTMPDNLTTWRMQARAISGDTLVGEGTNELLSTQPLLLRPALPRFLRVGDEAMLRLLVRNATDAPIDADVSIEVTGITLTDEETRSITVAPDTSEIVEWPARVNSAGSASVTFSAVATGGLNDAIVRELPIHLDVTPETTATGGVVRGGGTTEAIYLPGYAILEGGTLDVSVQASLSGSVASELSWFQRYGPRIWEDSEYIASRIVATIGVRRAQRSVSGGGTGLDLALETDVATLIGRQRGDGGWSWCTTCSSEPLVTAAVLLALGEAQEEGRAVDPNVINRARNYLVTTINALRDVENPADLNERAYLIYAAARAGSAPGMATYMESTFEQGRALLNNTGRAYLLLAFEEAGMGSGETARQLLNDLTSDVIPSANGNHWQNESAGPRFSTETQTTALVLQALVRIEPDHPLIEESVRWLVVARDDQGWERAIDRAQAVLSLSEYATSTGELAADYDFSVLLGEEEVLDGHFSPTDAAEPQGISISLSDLGAGVVSLLNLIRQATEPGRMYYSLNLRYQTPSRQAEAVSEGIAVSHEYTLLEDPETPITGASLGDTVRIKVTVLSDSDRTHVVVEDLLPAGLEPIDPNLAIVDPALKAQLESERREAALQDAAPDYYAPWYRWYYTPWQQVDTRDDRVTLRARDLPRGVHEFIYYARATTPGTFTVAPAHAEESYFPEVFGRSDAGTFEVVP